MWLEAFKGDADLLNFWELSNVGVSLLASEPEMIRSESVSFRLDLVPFCKDEFIQVEGNITLLLSSAVS